MLREKDDLSHTNHQAKLTARERERCLHLAFYQLEGNRYLSIFRLAVNSFVH